MKIKLTHQNKDIYHIELKDRQIWLNGKNTSHNIPERFLLYPIKHYEFSLSKEEVPELIKFLQDLK